MKSGFLAVMALLGHVSAVQLRKESMYDPEFYAGLYSNILLDVDSDKHHHGSNVGSNKAKDAYDFDPTSVSPYDSDVQHFPASNDERKAWFKWANEHKEHTYKIFDAQVGSASLTQKPNSNKGKDAYDHDQTTTSPYDAGSNINGGNVYGIKNSYTDNDTPIGPKEGDLVAALKKGYWWDRELKKELARPAGPGQGDARSGYAGAIPSKNGKADCEAVGAKCDEEPTEKKETPDAQTKAEEKAEKETEKEFDSITEEVKGKKAKKEKGEAPEEAAPPAPKEGAFAQVRMYAH